MAKAKKYEGPLANSYVQKGYGQVEGNKLSARYNGKIFASLPCKKDLTTVENGMFLCYDYAHRMVVTPGAKAPVEPMLVFNEVKVYEDREGDADFAMLADRYAAEVYNTTADGVYAHYGLGTGETLTEYDNRTEMKNGETDLQPYGMMGKEVNAIVPRLFKTDVGDIMTTNCIDLASKSAEDLKVGAVLKVGQNGYLTLGSDGGELSDSDMEWTIINVYTMPDLQPGVKLMRTK